MQIQWERLEEGGIGFGQLEKVMVAKRVISASGRVTNLLEVLWGRLVSKAKAYKCRLVVPAGLQRRLIQDEQLIVVVTVLKDGLPDNYPGF